MSVRVIVLPVGTYYVRVCYCDTSGIIIIMYVLV